MMETYYSVLEVARTASAEEIRAAYLKLVRQVHPDAIPNASPYWRKQAEERTQEVNEAYQVLSDRGKRLAYDRQIDAYLQSQPQNPQSTSAAPSQQPHRRTSQTAQAQSPRSGYTPQRPGASPRTRSELAWAAFWLFIGVCLLPVLFSADTTGTAAFAFFTSLFTLLPGAFGVFPNTIRKLSARFGRGKFSDPHFFGVGVISAMLVVILGIGISVRKASPTPSTQDISATHHGSSGWLRVEVPGYGKGWIPANREDAFLGKYPKAKVLERLTPGMIESGYRYNGGDPTKEKSWDLIKQKPPTPPKAGEVTRSSVAVQPHLGRAPAPAPTQARNTPTEIDPVHQSGPAQLHSMQSAAETLTSTTPPVGSKGRAIPATPVRVAAVNSGVALTAAASASPAATVLRDTGLMKLCAFDLGPYPCGFGAEQEVAELRKGDRVQVLSSEAREKNGQDVYHVRTDQGWDGWADANFIALDKPEKISPEGQMLTFGNAIAVSEADLEKSCAFSVGAYPCGFGAQPEIAALRKGDRVEVAPPEVRARDGEDIYRVRTIQGWEGWVDARVIAPEHPEEVSPEGKMLTFGDATLTRTTSLYKSCEFNLGAYPCGFGAEPEVAELREGDRVEIVPPEVRARDGEDIYQVRTIQGWEGWVDSNCLSLDRQ